MALVGEEDSMNRAQEKSSEAEAQEDRGSSMRGS